MSDIENGNQILRIDLLNSAQGIPVKDVEKSDLAGEEWVHDEAQWEAFKKAWWIVVRGTPWIEGSSDTMVRTYFSYEDYGRLTANLIDQVRWNGNKYDAVLTMPRWGVTLGKSLAEWLWVDLWYVHAQSYWHTERAGQVDFWAQILPPSLTKKLDLYKKWNWPQPVVLLTDDMADSGATFQKCVEQLEALGCRVDTATLFRKVPSSFHPTFTVIDSYPQMWIAQPGEAPFESSTKWNNVWNIQNDPTTLKILQIKKLIERAIWACDPEELSKVVFVPGGRGPLSSQVSTAISRILWMVGTPDKVIKGKALQYEFHQEFPELDVTSFSADGMNVSLGSGDEWTTLYVGLEPVSD